MDNLKTTLRRSKTILTKSFRKAIGSSKHSHTLTTAGAGTAAAQMTATMTTAPTGLIGPILRGNYEDTSSVADYSSTHSPDSSGISAGPASSNGQRRRITITAHPSTLAGSSAHRSVALAANSMVPASPSPAASVVDEQLSGISAGPAPFGGQRRRFTIAFRHGTSAESSAHRSVASVTNSIVPASPSLPKTVDDDANVSVVSENSVTGSTQADFFTPRAAAETAAVQVAERGVMQRSVLGDVWGLNGMY